MIPPFVFCFFGFFLKEPPDGGLGASLTSGCMEASSSWVNKKEEKKKNVRLSVSDDQIWSL